MAADITPAAAAAAPTTRHTLRNSFILIDEFSNALFVLKAQFTIRLIMHAALTNLNRLRRRGQRPEVRGQFTRKSHGYLQRENDAFS